MKVHVIQATAIAIIVLSIFVKAVTEPKPMPIPSTGMRAFGFVVSLVILFALVAGW